MVWRESAEALVEGFFVEDSEEDDTTEQTGLRRDMCRRIDDVDETEVVPLTKQEIAAVIKKIKSKKAPGWDAIEIQVVKKLWETQENILYNIFNDCKTLEIFPKEWKKSLVVTLIKAADKDPTLPASNRPICLLPVLGKILEGIILNRLQESNDLKLSDEQYVFRKGRSTEDAICKLRDHLDNNRGKYCLGMFLDIRNAFNNLWWPDIIDTLKKLECPGDILGLIQDYLRNRSLIFRTESGEVWRQMTKGCPQGSLLGPFLWNIVFDGMNQVLKTNGYGKIVAYADDSVILVEGNSRMELQCEGQGAMD